MGEQLWLQQSLADDLHLSQSEVSESLSRSKYAGLLNASGKKVNLLNLLELIEHGVKYIFPQRPGAIVRGITTAHSAPPLKDKIVSEEIYVWPYARGNAQGQSIEPLYKTVPIAVASNPELHKALALIDAIRVGKVREQQLAVQLVKQQLQNAK
ncbi:hypothetical protein SAMN05192588_0673 [Nonlabens sp. Hel1_33_55]|uniref:hypothetical protein n=1 Tax=Nonlabens sp. Hel1_33_55 TaxID=1336802 RepID=UPI000875B394|nr:hypothetical protein [Nonlabens sp. Hel1_33_55]SCY00246.1 hypothetical protein SAMN05192588_0673 [Nonlabens sp. Hel1_33_55]